MKQKSWISKNDVFDDPTKIPFPPLFPSHQSSLTQRPNGDAKPNGDEQVSVKRRKAPGDLNISNLQVSVLEINSWDFVKLHQ